MGNLNIGVMGNKIVRKKNNKNAPYQNFGKQFSTPISKFLLHSRSRINNIWKDIEYNKLEKSLYLKGAKTPY